MWYLLTIWGWFGFALWFLSLGPNFFLLRKRSRASVLQIPEPDAPLASVSVIVPACNEEGKIADCLKSLLNSDLPDLEIIAVNDRSTDRTGEIMDEIAKEDSRLNVIHNEILPEGWLGKNHAMHLGQKQARGEFLLFTDGDIIFKPDAIRLGIRYTLEKKLDHLCIIPEMISKTFLEKSLGSCFGFLFFAGSFIWLIPTPFKYAYAGVGAFNLIRKSVYEQTGGFETIKMDVLDDVKIGKLVKNNGFKQDFLNGLGMIQVRWQNSAWEVITGLEKNGFAALEYSFLRLLIVTSAIFAFFIAPYPAIFLISGSSSYGFWAIIFFLHIAYLFFSQSLGTDWKTVFLFPLGLLLIVYAFWRSTFITLKNGGISWRKTFYPLGELRKNVYR